ncbi:F-box protein At5g18160-like [Daucus carota subsp. sativus]|uniref:F-box protein At5g18160-like n=1 Tax=Daucus carota subsp. sativus TaxID=79200 RepID=UPI0007EF6969|nr:PREDICTED: F-box protein At5g18160-like [Daucus carota subsp. sativus]
MHRRKRTRRNRSTHELPQHIIHNEILTRLPAKYIARFSLVCKSWKTLFSTPEFINSHRLHSHSHKDEGDFLIAKKDPLGPGIFILSHSSENQVPAVSAAYNLLLGSIHGLVCMASLTGKVFCLWNPVLGKFMEIRLPSEHSENCDAQLLGGFSWDHVQNDYKLVVVGYNHSTASSTRFSVYSFKYGSWTGVPVNPDHSMLFVPSNFMTPPITIVKGLPYWGCITYFLLPGMRRRRKFIFGYKFVAASNEFTMLPYLDSVRIRGKDFKFVNIKDCFVGLAYRDNMADIYSLDNESFDHGVWSKIYTIGPINNSLEALWPSNCFENGGDNLVACPIGPVYICDPKTKKTEVLRCEHKSKHSVPRKCSTYIPALILRLCFSYMPTLVCVQGMKTMQEFSVEESKKLTLESDRSCC